MPLYHSPEQRPAGSQYGLLLRDVVENGIDVQTKQGVDALAIVGHAMRFKIADGAAVITERSIAGFWQKAIGELCAFINGARTLEQLEAFGCDWWGPWATEEKCRSRGLPPGDLGPGSYGHAFHNFTTNLDGEDQGFDQLPALIRKLQDLPLDRTAVLSPWIPNANLRDAETKSRNTIAPCHGWVHALVLNGELHLVHNQRSGDVPVGVPANMVQYCALGLMLEQLTGYPFVQYVHWIQYAHVYKDQVEAVEEMLTRDARPLPTMTLTDEGKAITDVHDFRAEHFALTDYEPHPSIGRIPVST